MVPIARPPTSFTQPFPGAPFINQSFPTVDISTLNMFPVSAGGKPVIPIPTMPSKSPHPCHHTQPPLNHHIPLSPHQIPTLPPAPDPISSKPCGDTPPLCVTTVSPHPSLCHHTPSLCHHTPNPGDRLLTHVFEICFTAALTNGRPPMLSAPSIPASIVAARPPSLPPNKQ